MNSKIYAPCIADHSKKASRLTCLSYVYTFLAPHICPIVVTDSDAPPKLRNPSRRRITPRLISLSRGPCEEESFNHEPDLAPSRGSPAWARGWRSNAVHLEQGKTFPEWWSRHRHQPGIARLYFWGGVGAELPFL